MMKYFDPKNSSLGPFEDAFAATACSIAFTSTFLAGAFLNKSRINLETFPKIILKNPTIFSKTSLRIFTILLKNPFFFSVLSVPGFLSVFAPIEVTASASASRECWRQRLSIEFAACLLRRLEFLP